MGVGGGLSLRRLHSERPRTVSTESALSCLNLVSVFRKLERSGDHITNIAEEIVFFIDAKVLKHSGQTDEHYLNDKK